MLFSAGIDYKNTTLELREKLAFDDEKAIYATKEICEYEGVRGCVILSTCNRSEIYIFSNAYIEAEKLLLKFAGADRELYSGKTNTYSGTDAIYHIIETACGINSAIKGESQIISQIGKSAELSRKWGCLCAELDVLFRIAVATGKKSVSNAADGYRLSSVYKAAELLEEKCGSLKGKKCLVIGNGRVGLLAARLLVERKAEVTITLRAYKHSENIIPKGCGYIPYSDRINAVKSSDILISGTKSPHFTLTKAMTGGIRIPEYIIDLAVPRDIDPQIFENRNIHYYNIDDFVSGGEEIRAEVYDLIEDGVSEYMNWYNYRESIEDMENIKNIISKRILSTAALDEEAVRTAVSKTADMIFGSIKGAITPQIIEDCHKRIKGRARL